MSPTSAVHSPLNPLSSSFMSNDPSSSSAFQVEDFFNMDLLPDNPSPTSPSSSSSAAHPNSFSAQSTSSRSSSRSPSGTFDPLPPTPAENDPLNSFDIGGININIDSSAFGSNGGLPTIDEDALFPYGFNATANDLFKPGSDALAGFSHTNFDLFASFDGSLSGVAASPDNASLPSVSTSASAPQNVSVSSTSNKVPNAATGVASGFSIDPHLFGTPATSDVSTIENSPNSEDDKGHEAGTEDNEDPLVVAPVKVGGKGAQRKGTLHSGGITKKSSIGPQSIFGALAAGGDRAQSPTISVKGGKGKSAKDLADDKDDDDLDDWRPSPEEYQKMSSKEKRQLRNKISARNFRIRRKEYIHTLEGDIADRDNLIQAIRNELGTTKSENNALRQEVAALKKAILEGRASPMLPPPAPLSPLSPLQTFAHVNGGNTASASSTPSNNNIIKPNTNKDLPTSPRLAATAGGFWGGASGGFGSLGGGITPVHTAIIPETSPFERANENINPALNSLPPTKTGENAQHQVLSQVLAQLYGNGYGSVPAAQNNGAGYYGSNNAMAGFDAFADVNPFTLRNLDKYRMQLWGSAAAMQAQRGARMQSPAPNSANTSPSSSPNGSPSLSGLASNLRPHYFASSSPTSPTTSSRSALGSLLSGKKHFTGSSHGLPSPPPSPRIGEKERERSSSSSSSYVAQMQQRERAQQQLQTHALLATMATQTVLQKMGQAFWDAFSGSSSSTASSTNASKAWDTEKLQRVLEGKAVLRVVDVPQRPAAPTSPSADNLVERMGSLSLDKAEEKDDKKGFLSRFSCSSCSKQ